MDFEKQQKNLRKMLAEGTGPSAGPNVSRHRSVDMNEKAGQTSHFRLSLPALNNESGSVLHQNSSLNVDLPMLDKGVGHSTLTDPETAYVRGTVGTMGSNAKIYGDGTDTTRGHASLYD